ncbi:hypothetical protein [Streptomyces mirabilis]
MRDVNDGPQSNVTVEYTGDAVAQGGNANTGIVHGQIPALIAGMTLAPFLTAVVTHFGNRLAGAVDETTRTALRRFMRRELPDAAVNDGVRHGPIALQNEHGWSVLVHEELPAEAIGQLVALHAAPVPGLGRDAPGITQLVWDRNRWLLAGWSADGPALHRWDAELGNWTSLH